MLGLASTVAYLNLDAGGMDLRWMQPWRRRSGGGVKWWCSVVLWVLLVVCCYWIWWCGEAVVAAATPSFLMPAGWCSGRNPGILLRLRLKDSGGALLPWSSSMTTRALPRRHVVTTLGARYVYLLLLSALLLPSKPLSDLA